jgi:predicted CopG family antitoxin
MRKTITLSYEIWKELLVLKAELNARSLDDVIRRLLEKWKQ